MLPVAPAMIFLNKISLLFLFSFFNLWALQPQFFFWPLIQAFQMQNPPGHSNPGLQKMLRYLANLCEDFPCFGGASDSEMLLREVRDRVLGE